MREYTWMLFYYGYLAKMLIACWVDSPRGSELLMKAHPHYSGLSAYLFIEEGLLTYNLTLLATRSQENLVLYKTQDPVEFLDNIHPAITNYVAGQLNDDEEEVAYTYPGVFRWKALLCNLYYETFGEDLIEFQVVPKRTIS